MSENIQGNSFYDSDSFLSDNDDHPRNRKKITSQPDIRSIRNRGVKQIYSTASKSQRNNNKRHLNKQLPPVNYEVAAQRILSARNHKIIDQTNTIHHLSQQIDELKNENKTLKTQTIRQERALNKIETKQTDLPKILEQHEAEVSNLKELLRRSKDSLNIKTKHSKDCDNEIVKLRDSLAKANQLIGDKNLDERSHLQARISDLQERLDANDKALEVSNKHIENLDKTHKQEIYSLKKQMKKYVVHYQGLENELESLKSNLKEKERLLEIQNIYSKRFKLLQKTPGYGNDHQGGNTYSSEPQSDQLLDKLDFSRVSQGKEDKYIDQKLETHEVRHDPTSTAQLATNLMDPERIKQDIRQIIEDEILSGRIRPFEVTVRSSDDGIDNVSNKSPDKQSVLDSYNTDRAVESEIFDKDPVTQIQSVTDEPVAPEIEVVVSEQEQRQRQLLLLKLSELDARTVIEEARTLAYSYPHDNDYLTNEQSTSDIETIPANSAQQTYKFSSTVDNLHHGLPARPSNGDLQMKRASKGSHIDALHSQKNNSSVEGTDSLPPLKSGEKKRKESELLTELFGGDFEPQPVVHGRPYPSGARKSRSGSHLWEKEDGLRSKPLVVEPIFGLTGASMESNAPEDIEEIVL